LAKSTKKAYIRLLAKSNPAEYRSVSRPNEGGPVLWSDEADRVYLLREGRRLDEGAVTSVLQRAQLDALYGSRGNTNRGTIQSPQELN